MTEIKSLNSLSPFATSLFPLFWFRMSFLSRRIVVISFHLVWILWTKLPSVNIIVQVFILFVLKHNSLLQVNFLTIFFLCCSVINTFSIVLPENFFIIEMPFSTKIFQWLCRRFRRKSSSLGWSRGLSCLPLCSLSISSYLLDIHL